MTLDNNPRVFAEKRRFILIERIEKLSRYRWQRCVPEYDEVTGIVKRIYINPYIKTEKADKIIKAINKELSQIEKFLKQFNL